MTSFVRHNTFPVVLAVLFTLLNAVKPLQIDDTAYEYYARQMAAKPLDPYGFEVFWWETPDPANEVLAPPAFCYAWSVAHRFSADPVVWKLCLLPWSLLLVFGLRGMLRRFAPRLEWPLLVMLVFSPALLPSLNLMLDVPALALSLTALNLFFRAADRDSVALAAWAGLVAGLAMQTKYTGFLAPGAMLLWSATTGRWRVWPAAALVAVHVFVTWEFLVALLYGDSHFLLALRGGGSMLDRTRNLPCLFAQLGGLVPFGVALGLSALGVPRRWVWAAVAAMGAAFAAVWLLDVTFVARDLFGRPMEQPVDFQLAEVFFHTISYAGAVVLVLVTRKLLRTEMAVGDRHTLFLVLWLGLEVVGFVALTPFPAVRRVFGVGLVSALLVGRLAARRPRLLWRRGLIPGLTAGSVLLALGYWALDLRGAAEQRDLAAAAARHVAEHGGGRMWFTGHWGFQFYAERAGMRPVVPGDHRDQTVFRAGDWLVLPDSSLNQQRLRLPENCVELRAELPANTPVRLRTVPCFYGGRTALEHQEGPGLVVRVYRVRREFAAEP